MSTTPRPSRQSGRSGGKTNAVSPPIPATKNPNIMSSRCSPIRRGVFIWGMSATTRLAMWWHAIGAPAASMFCTRWDGTPSAYRPRMPRWSAGSTRENGQRKTSVPCAHSCAAWGCPMTGTANWPHARRITTSMNSGCFFAFLTRDCLSQGKLGQLGPGREYGARK